MEGKLTGPWVDELNRTWQSLVPSLGKKKLQLDLRAVAFVDARGRDLLRRICMETKVNFLADSPLTKYFVDEATRQSPKNGKEGA